MFELLSGFPEALLFTCFDFFGVLGLALCWVRAASGPFWDNNFHFLGQFCSEDDLNKLLLFPVPEILAFKLRKNPHAQKRINWHFHPPFQKRNQPP